MVTCEETRAALVAAIEEAETNYETIVKEQLAMYPFDDTTAWDALAADEKVAEWSRKNQAKGLIDMAKNDLAVYDGKRMSFYNSRDETFRLLEEEKNAQIAAIEEQYKTDRNSTAAEMQDKEDYANATGDWELIGYTVDWAENI
jgi:hypothetical protein